MSTSKSYLEYILDSLSGLEDITYKSMMGEYIVYYRRKIAAYICDDRLLVKPVNAAKRLLPNAPTEPPYDGAKPMLLVEDTDNRGFSHSFSPKCTMNCPSRGLKRRNDCNRIVIDIKCRIMYNKNGTYCITLKQPLR